MSLSNLSKAQCGCQMFWSSFPFKICLPLNFIFKLVSDKVCSIMVIGGFQKNSNEVLFESLTNIQLPSLPVDIHCSTEAIFNGTLLVCGGVERVEQCLQLENGQWKEHSNMNHMRRYASAVQTKSGIFIFGGIDSPNTFEYLPNNSRTWILGETEIQDGFQDGCVIVINSGQDVLLFGGYQTERRILKFNINERTFAELPLQLNVGRYGHRCAFIPNTNKIIITGGRALNYPDVSEILDLDKAKITMMTSPMNFKRSRHGIGVITIDVEDKLVVFGGYNENGCINSVELFDDETQTWEMTDIKLTEGKYSFGFFTVKLGNILYGL